jgi:hypothetical protein
MSYAGTKAAVDEFRVQGHALETQLYWHLTANHYPPINIVFMGSAIKAIELARQDEFDTIIELPNGKKLPVVTIIAELHLEPFLN